MLLFIHLEESEVLFTCQSFLCLCLVLREEVSEMANTTKSTCKQDDRRSKHVCTCEHVTVPTNRVKQPKLTYTGVKQEFLSSVHQV